MGNGYRWGRIVAWTIILGLVAALGFWAGRQVLVPPEDPLEGAGQAVTYTVQEGQVGRSLRFTTAAEWELVPLARNSASGTITTVDFVSGDLASVGQVLYTVDLRPVIVGEGAIPSFRDLSLNATGPDVAQLQELLTTLGHFTGEVNGTYGFTTQVAVQAWQGAMGITPTDGVFRRGEVVYLPSLPEAIALAEELRIGSPVGGGEELILGVPSDPEFWIPLSTEQRDLIPLAADVFVTYPEGRWAARVDRAVEGDFGQFNLYLTAVDGGAVCGADCTRWVDLLERTNFESQIVVIPETSGAVVPVAAIRSDAGNQTFVETEAGERIDITVIESSQGIAVVEGVDLDTVIVLPMTAPPGP